MYIKLIEETNSDALISLRCRRFGKSLFANMLSEYYDISNIKIIQANTSTVESIPKIIEA